MLQIIEFIAPAHAFFLQRNVPFNNLISMTILFLYGRPFY